MALGSSILSGLLALFAVIQVYPLIWLVMFSLKSNEEIFSEQALSLPKQFRWQNYRAAFVDAQIGRYFLNSVIVYCIHYRPGMYIRFDDVVCYCPHAMETPKSHPCYISGRTNDSGAGRVAASDDWLWEAENF